MDFSKQTVNSTTNGIGVIAGAPQIIQGITLLLAGDLAGGGIALIQGLALLAGFYFIGKGQ